MLGMYPIGTRPIAALPRRTSIGPAFAVFAAAGLASMPATMLAQALSSVASAGVGSFNTMSGPASGVLAAAGVGAFSPKLSAVSRMSVTSSGIGALSASITAPARMVVPFTGVGAFTIPAASLAFASSLMQGWTIFGGADQPASAAAFNGYGTLSAVAYAFFADAEKAGPAKIFSEVRLTFADQENRIAVVPADDRVYEVPPPIDPQPIPNRRRTL